MNENATNQNLEDRRTLISLGIIATAIGLLNANFTKSNLLEAARGVLALSAAIAFIYLLLTAATLKYKYNDDIGGIPFLPQYRQEAYDFAVNIFGTSSIVWLWFTVSNFLHDHGVKTHYLRWGFVGAFLLLILYTVMTAFLHGISERTNGKKSE